MELVAFVASGYEGLGEIQQRDWRRLGVFTGSFTAAAAAFVLDLKIARELPPDTVAHIRLARLASLGLLDHDKLHGRFALRAAARQFAREQMSAEELAEAHQRHAEYYLRVLGRANHLAAAGGETGQDGLALFGSEWTEIQAGQRWVAKQPGGAASEYALSGEKCLEQRVDPYERILWHEDALRAARETGDLRAQYQHLSGLAQAFFVLGDMVQHMAYREQAMAVGMQTGQWSDEEAEFGSGSRAVGF
ncbi:MAG TPA: hypothetical protein VIO36_10195 [Anaerolineaceae bacterium]